MATPKAPSAPYSPGQDPASIEANRAYQEALAKLAQSLDQRKNRFFEPTLLAAAQGFLQPGTSNFFDSLGNVAGNIAKSQEAQIAEDQAIAQQRVEIAGRGVELQRLKNREAMVQGILNRNKGSPSPEAAGDKPTQPGALPSSAQPGSAGSAAPQGGLSQAAPKKPGVPGEPKYGVRFAEAGEEPISEEQFIALAISGGMDPAEAVQKWETINNARTQVKDTGVYDVRKGIFYPAGYKTVNVQIYGYPGQTFEISETDAFRLNNLRQAGDREGYMALAKSLVNPFGGASGAAPTGGAAAGTTPAVAAPVNAARVAPPAAVAPGAAPSAAVPSAVPAGAAGPVAAAVTTPAPRDPSDFAGNEETPAAQRVAVTELLNNLDVKKPGAVAYLRSIFEGIKDPAYRQMAFQALDARVAALSQSSPAQPAAAAKPPVQPVAAAASTGATAVQPAAAAAKPVAAAAQPAAPVVQPVISPVAQPVVAAARPAAAGSAAATGILSREELAAKVAREQEIAKAETQIEIEKRKTFAQKADEAPDTLTTATILRDFAKDPDAGKMTGILSNSKVSSQIATLLKTGIGTTDLRVAIPGIETAMRNAGLNPTQQAKFRVFLQTVEQMRLQMAKYAKGAVSNFEQELFGAASVSTEDTADAVRMKADLLTRRAQFDREAYKQWKKSKLTADEFKESDDYLKMRVAYDKDLSAISLGAQRFQSGAARPVGAAAAAGQPSSGYIRDQKTGVIRRKKAGE
jgi:hypothetical protein